MVLFLVWVSQTSVEFWDMCSLLISLTQRQIAVVDSSTYFLNHCTLFDTLRLMPPAAAVSPKCSLSLSSSRWVRQSTPHAKCGSLEVSGSSDDGCCCLYPLSLWVIITLGGRGRCLCLPKVSTHSQVSSNSIGSCRESASLNGLPVGVQGQSLMTDTPLCHQHNHLQTNVIFSDMWTQFSIIFLSVDKKSQGL